MNQNFVTLEEEQGKNILKFAAGILLLATGSRPIGFT